MERRRLQRAPWFRIEGDAFTDGPTPDTGPSLVLEVDSARLGFAATGIRVLARVGNSVISTDIGTLTRESLLTWSRSHRDLAPAIVAILLGHPAVTIPVTRHVSRYDERGNELGPVADSKVTVWMCRRVWDFPRRAAPASAGVASCTVCGAAVAFNPARVLDAPKVCMQCCGVEPD